MKLATLFIGAACLLALPSGALACTCSPYSITTSTPADGAIDVPLNAAFELLGTLDAASVTLRDTQGRTVDVSVTAGPTAGCPGTSAQVIPRQPLLANTTYVLHTTSRIGRSEGHDTVTFTTGTQVLPDDEPPPPQGAASALVDFVPNGAACASGPVALCASADSWENVELVARRGDQTLLRWVLRTTDNQFTLTALPECVELRRLSATGRRSAPLTICGDALRTRAFRPDDLTEDGLVSCKGGLIGELPPDADVSGGGCALASGLRGAGTAALIAIAMLLVSARRARHRQT